MKIFGILFFCGVVWRTAISVQEESLSWRTIKGCYRVCRSTNFLASVEKIESCEERIEQMLSISDEKIEKISPRAFQNLTISSLILNFAHTQLDVKIDSFMGLPLLKSLWISPGNVQLNGNSFQHLPSLTSLLFGFNGSQQSLRAVLSGLRKLESLTIVNSHLGKIDENTFVNYSSKISFLELRDTHITEITNKGFSPLRSLKILVLFSNKLKNIQPGSFKSLYQLETLKIISNELTWISADIFGELGNLNYLDLRNNKINDIDNYAFFDLNISKIFLSNNDLRELKSTCFLWLSALEELHLDFNQMKTIRSGALQSLRISKLNLRNNDLSIIDSGAFQHLNATTLDLSGNTKLTIDKISWGKSSIERILISGAEYTIVNGVYGKN